MCLCIHVRACAYVRVCVCMRACVFGIFALSSPLQNPADSAVVVADAPPPKSTPFLRFFQTFPTHFAKTPRISPEDDLVVAAAAPRRSC